MERLLGGDSRMLMCVVEARNHSRAAEVMHGRARKPSAKPDEGPGAHDPLTPTRKRFRLIVGERDDGASGDDLKVDQT